MIIGLTGRKNAGKDTAAQYFVDKHGFEKIAFADGLKAATCALFDITPEWIEQYKNDVSVRVQLVRRYSQPSLTDATEYKAEMSLRQFLQRMGTEVGREVFGSSFWVELLHDRLSANKNYVISDVRFNNESPICDYMIEIVRNNIGNDPHVSEQGLREELIDYIVPNNGSIEDLHSRLEAVMQEIIATLPTFSVGR
jgi:hypothetical protein